jgi:hypothetical protein
MLVAFTIGGCGSSREHTYALDVAPTTGLLAIDVENFAGTVEVRAGGPASQGRSRPDRASVIADAEVDASVTDDAARQEILDGIAVNADLIEDAARAVLRVRSTSSHAGAQDHRVHLTIIVPRADGVRIRNSGGNVVVVGTGGATQIENRFGAIEVRTDKDMNQPVTLTNVDGNIYYQVPTTSSGAFDLETLDGIVRYKDRVGSSDHVYSTGRTVHQARLNEGQSPVIARTNKGDVMVWVDKDPVALTRIIKKSFPDPRDMMFLQGSRRHTRNLPEDHPEVTGSRRTKDLMFYD